MPALKSRPVAAAALSVIVLSGMLLSGCAGPGTASTVEPRFQSAIDVFLEQDRVAPPPRYAVLFIGSSIFREWEDLVSQMAPLPVFNRAFGGSRTTDILYHMDRIVLPYEPRIIVYYCGSNDINASKEAAEIAQNFFEFCRRVREKLPATRIFYVSINRAPQKRDRWNVVDSTNAMVRKYCGETERLGFIDVNQVLVDSDGDPRLDLFRDDQLHLTPRAYEEFSRVIKPVIERAWRDL